jgi:hypothetical protein
MDRISGEIRFTDLLRQVGESDTSTLVEELIRTDTPNAFWVSLLEESSHDDQ